ncbi:MAG: hypothetical protein JWO77_3401 [Ilumatobacteraceae bacterium]|nr:hypothetical protein [Ilumatobacteraceae bacterium]
MTEESELLSALGALADALQNQRTLGMKLASIAETCVSSVPGCDAASIALSINGRSVTAVATARVALELDMVQYDLDDGPCLRAFRTMDSLRIDIVEPFEEFPHFAVAAQAEGITSVLSLPALWGDELVATLNLYSRQGPFDESAATVGAVLAAQVSIAVSRSPEFSAARNVVEHAQRNADDDAEISVATGMLMANQSCTAEQAAGLLREAAVEDERTVVEIAKRILDQHKNSG